MSPFKVVRKLIYLYYVTEFVVVSGEPLFFLIETPQKLAYTYEIRSSDAIGARFPSTPFKNIPLRYAEPSHACSQILPLFQDAVLIERGSCPFITKALYASKAGARVAIITESSSESSKWIDMVGDGSDKKSDIPVAFLPGASGKRIRDYLMYGGGEVRITIPLNLSKFDVRTYQAKPPWELW
ncbi:unnamed protein product [Enterobius vermicularis]|uniref:PA domain-containing protein n=1 Tax=Enterobius vermicularis TaxID=51028 RepID=A0A0N4V8L0_ENTVE|nr:unnamed protein product [Enterobius vermicularis]